MCAASHSSRTVRSDKDAARCVSSSLRRGVRISNASKAGAAAIRSMHHSSGFGRSLTRARRGASFAACGALRSRAACRAGCRGQLSISAMAARQALANLGLGHNGAGNSRHLLFGAPAALGAGRSWRALGFRDRLDAELLHRVDALLAQNLLHALYGVTLGVQQAADAAQQRQVLGAVVTRPPPRFIGPNLRKATFPEAENVLGEP